MLLCFLTIITASETYLACMLSRGSDEFETTIKYSCIRASLNRLAQCESVPDEDCAYSPHDGLPESYSLPEILKNFLRANPEKINICCHLYITKDFTIEHVIVQLCHDTYTLLNILGQINDTQIKYCECEAINLLQRAVIFNNINAIQYLCTYRKDVLMELINIGTTVPLQFNLKNESFFFPCNSTPLHIAVKLGYFTLALKLLKNGANPTILDAAQKTPYNYLKDQSEYSLDSKTYEDFLELNRLRI